MTLRVLDPGLYTLVVDSGRPATRSLGVPVGGAADRFALAIGNALVGNPPDAPALEMTLAGPTVQAGCDLACVVYGAPFELTGPEGRLTAGKTFTLHGGEELRIGGTPEKIRAYLCVRGGLQAPLILGSQSGLQPVSAGTEFPCLAGTIPGRFVLPSTTWNQEPHILRALPGPQADWFPAEEFYCQEFTVTPESNRMGLRLEGNPLPVPNRELVSEPVSPGSVQVTSNGQCIVLAVDGQTIGGYPKLAQVITADLDKLGQLRPGDWVSFHEVSMREAEMLFHRKQAELHEWVTRLRVAELFGS
jgi:antagonist of KipI